jgi:uncharacterized membrane protein YeaQ/YmgE (transglycosylase-associated protein family)
MEWAVIGVIVFFALFILFWLTFGLLGFLLTLLIAGLIGALADAIVPGRLPLGWLGAVLAGLLGGWLGTAVLGPIGPRLFGVEIVPTFIGTVVLAFAWELIGRLRERQGA